jgi:hypothetical protein
LFTGLSFILFFPSRKKSKIKNQKSKIKNQKSKIRNQESEIRNPESEIIASQIPYRYGSHRKTMKCDKLQLKEQIHSMIE